MCVGRRVCDRGSCVCVSGEGEVAYVSGGMCVCDWRFVCVCVCVWGG